jgi:hypothetical protein
MKRAEIHATDSTTKRLRANSATLESIAEYAVWVPARLLQKLTEAYAVPALTLLLSYVQHLCAATDLNRVNYID